MEVFFKKDSVKCTSVQGQVGGCGTGMVAGELIVTKKKTNN